MGANNSDITKCVVCGNPSPEEGFSPRYRNTCRPCAREKERQATFVKTGVMPKPRHKWVGPNKICNQCGKKKHEDDYSWRETPKGKVVRNSICKECIGSYQKERAQDPEVRIKQNLATKKYYHFSGGHTKEKNARYLREYGITLKDKENMISEINGRCPVCSTDDPGRFWVVDHCHKTGKVRGILCDKCNKMLGLARDSVETLQAASKYLLKHLESEETE